MRPELGDTAGFVPVIAGQTLLPSDGARVVNRRRLDRHSLETLSSGLPRTNCSDLIYRHRLSLSPSGLRW